MENPTVLKPSRGDCETTLLGSDDIESLEDIDAVAPVGEVGGLCSEGPTVPCRTWVAEKVGRRILNQRIPGIIKTDRGGDDLGEARLNRGIPVDGSFVPAVARVRTSSRPRHQD